MKTIKTLITLFVTSLLLSGCASLPPNIEPDTSYAKYNYKQLIDSYPIKKSATPSVGESKLLVIPVWFNDSSTYIKPERRSVIREDIRKAYFGYEEDIGWESVSTFYKKDSFNKATISGEVSAWYDCDKLSTYYYEDKDDKTAKLVLEAVNWYKINNPTVDMKDFDKDKDGYLDGVILIYAAPNHQSLKIDQDNLWAYCYWTRLSGNVESPVANAFFWASYDFMYDSETSLKKTELTNFGGGYNANGLLIDTHTYIHEMGHLFGLEDYYDYAEDGYLPAGGYSMQDMNVGSHDPFSRFSLGWAKALVPTKSSTFDVKPVESSGEIVILSNSFSGSPFDEYIILELYTPTILNVRDSTYRYGDKYPMGPKASGVRIWHVDSRLVDVTDDKSAYLTTSIIEGHKYINATNNTSSGDRAKNYGGKYSYNLNHLIRNNVKAEYNNKYVFGAGDLFLTGDSFSLSKYQTQFDQKNKLNSGKDFTWTVKFNYVGSDKMTISCII